MNFDLDMDLIFGPENIPDLDIMFTDPKSDLKSEKTRIYIYCTL